MPSKWPNTQKPTIMGADADSNWSRQQATGAQLPRFNLTLGLTSCVTLGRFLNLSVLSFLICKNRVHIVLTLKGRRGD